METPEQHFPSQLSFFPKSSESTNSAIIADKQTPPFDQADGG
jgi:hypothetical protein